MLTLVPTPIGNLEDISLRALKALEEAELIFCEDTRVTKKLLGLFSQKYNINFENKEYKSYHSHNENQILKTLESKLFEKNVVYVSDAGMPCVSDPGATLVDFCIKNNIKYDVIPGANAVLTAYAMSGFIYNTFTFHGFLPHKGSDRTNKLKSIMQSDKLGILYESPHRLLKLLEEVTIIDETRTIFLVKELTKLHQESFKDSAKNIFETFKSINIKGEWVVLIEPIVFQGEALNISDIQDLDLAPKVKAKLLSKLTGRKTKDIYQELL
ncbi:16S rRNA (cytidine(1402)-2'-O)-methyltransferase [Malaciobacter molluscorum]|uniref:16S rRNA (cytidine(1402)-2'-O)-methyltransferase n=1 Tax=Malaciobacter molluscorum TaxID=1032072 RepID=UPI00100B725C|nr:16S rRNA (cytidine(1402)-2'-O)-methyltransferase [Malaciobacter molluscorum]RXJ93737.1 16S rRNA (cytidine(1402)-2'-O)-methyltransferase [Malaciobacter molluscorum]